MYWLWLPHSGTTENTTMTGSSGMLPSSDWQSLAKNHQSFQAGQSFHVLLMINPDFFFATRRCGEVGFRQYTILLHIGLVLITGVGGNFQT